LSKRYDDPLAWTRKAVLNVAGSGSSQATARSPSTPPRSGAPGPAPWSRTEARVRRLCGRAARDDLDQGPPGPGRRSRHAFDRNGSPNPRTTAAFIVFSTTRSASHWNGSRARHRIHQGSIMDPAYFSAFSALAGSAIGGLTSLAASWLTQRGQVSAQQLAHDIGRREELYKEFIEETSKSFADAIEHSEVDAAKIVRLYAWSAGCVSCRRNEWSNRRTGSWD
jgi:hypothetical protein